MAPNITITRLTHQRINFDRLDLSLDMTLNPELFRASIQVIVTTLLCLLVMAVPVRAATEPSWKSNKGIVVVVGSPFIELYVQPGRGYARYHVVEKNERMRIFKERTGWYKVETQDGKIGWVRQRDLRQVYDTEGYLLDFGVPAWDEAQNPWQIGLMAGHINGAIAYTIYTGYRFTPNISTEIKYSQGFGDFSNVKLGSLMLLHQPFPAWRYSPFFTLGAGVLQTFPDSVLVEVEDEQDNIVTVGGGLMVYLSHKVIARLEYNKHTILTTRDNNEEVEEWKAGFSVLF